MEFTERFNRLVEEMDAEIERCKLAYKGMKVIDPEDIKQEARLGIMHGLSLYDSNKNASEYTYCKQWAWSYVQDFVSRFGYSMSIPRDYFKKKRDAEMALSGRFDSDSESNCSARTMSKKTALTYIRTPDMVRMDKPVREDSEDTMVDNYQDDNSLSMEVKIAYKLAYKGIHELLTPLQQDVFLMSVGIRFDEHQQPYHVCEMTNEEIGKKIGKTPQAVSYIVKTSAEKIRNYLIEQGVDHF